MLGKTIKTKVSAAAVAVGLMAGAASAGTVNIAPTNGSPFGTPKWASEVTFTIDGETERAEAGLFRLRATDTMTNASEVILAWCLEVQQALDIPTQYQVNAIPPSAAVAENLDKLFRHGFHKVRQNSGDPEKQNKKAAGFQLAIWEIVSDTGNGLDITDGDFTVVTGAGATLAGVAANAQNYLNMLDKTGPGKRDYEYTYYNSDTSQDLISANRVAVVPVPAAGLLLLSGLAGFAAMRRRRKA